MITIELEGTEYTMPGSWSEVNLKTFEKIKSQLAIFGDYKSMNQYALDLIQILSEAPVDKLRNMTRASFDELQASISWVTEQVKLDNKKVFNINGVEYMAFENLNSMSMGDSISLEIMIAESNETNVQSNILPILIRKSKEVIKDGQVVKVPGEFDADNYNETKELLMENLKINEIMWVRDFF